MDALERLTIGAWKAWGDGWAMFCSCSRCGEVKACRGKHRHHMLCLDCFDAGEESR